MYALQNRGVAFIICVIMILGGCFFGAGASVSSLRSSGEALFYSSGMQQDLIDFSGSCANVAAVAGNYFAESDADILKINELRAGLSSASSPGEKYKAAEALMTGAERLMERLREDNIPAEDADRANRALEDARGKQSLLAKGPYNGAASFYNMNLEKFPAGFLAKLTGNKPLELYG